MFEKKVYVGDKIIKEEILLIENSIRFTIVNFEDGTKEIFGEEILEILKSDKPIDASALRDKKITFVAEKILELLLVHNVKPSEFEFLTAVLQGSLQENIKKANDILWKKQSHERTMLDIDKILKNKGGEIPTA